MPPSAPFHSFLLPYDIRVDDFTTPRDPTFKSPALYLLSHTHSDHLTGLSAKSFGSKVICSKDSKHMLLSNEPANERIAFDNGDRSVITKPYAHLKVDRHQPGVYARDLLRPFPLNTPTEIELSDDVTITLTLLDANHCPGSVMFLIEGPKGNILHTGDMRAEPEFLASLSRNPLLQRYIRPSASFSDSADSDTTNKPLRTLDAIYLDTACLLSHHDLLSKEEACLGLVKLMSFFPPSTKFFINIWTPGYEDILKAIGRAFNSKIHVDRYKHKIYTGINDPFLRSLLTCDPDASRFHACERFNRCEVVKHGSSDVIYVNPVTLSRSKWRAYYAKTMATFERGEPIHNLLCPLSRHSSLPELRNFVSLFKPKLIVPNFLNPALGNFDWACMPKMFAGCLGEGGEMAIRASMELADVFIDDLDYIPPTEESDIIEAGVEVENVIGDGAEDLAKQWTGSEGFTQSPSGRLFVQMRKFLGPRGQLLLAEHMSTRPIPADADHDSDDYNEDDDEARERTAKLLFASSSRSCSSVEQRQTRAQSIRSRSPLSSSRSYSTPVRLGEDVTPLSHRRQALLFENSSPPFGDSSSPPEEQPQRLLASRTSSIFDMIFFKKASPTNSRRPLTTVFVQPPSSSNGLGSPFSTPSRIPKGTQKHFFLRLPLASPSISPSPKRISQTSFEPHVTSQLSSPPEEQSNQTPSSVQHSFPSKSSGESKRTSVFDLVSPHPSKRRKLSINESRANQFPLNSTHTTYQQITSNSQDEDAGDEAIISVSLSESKASVVSVLMPLTARISEKQRRAKAKVKQIEIQKKLLQALPRTQISSNALEKLKRRQQQRAKSQIEVDNMNRAVLPLRSAG